MIVDDLGMEGENINKDTDGAVYTGEGVANSDPDDVITL